MPKLHDHDLSRWEERFARFLEEHLDGSDPAHDLAHVARVVATAKKLARSEGACAEVVVPAAWLHDCVTLPKDSPRRSRASREAARRAGEFLAGAGYPAELIPAVRHAIEAHSFSAGIAPQTPEARVVQDADRLDALGAVGIARCLMVGGGLRLPLYAGEEPLPRTRKPDDTAWILDHFFIKLLKLPETMQTAPGRAEAKRRRRFMEAFLRQLEAEIVGEGES
ncbi:MAG: HD domain-containing protein [bacterium]|nr:HD domain-containing protein [bacterium]